MSALIIRLPAEKRARFKELARHPKVSVNKLVEEMATILLADSTPRPATAFARAVARAGSSAAGRRKPSRRFEVEPASIKALLRAIHRDPKNVIRALAG